MTIGLLTTWIFTFGAATIIEIEGIFLPYFKMVVIPLFKNEMSFDEFKSFVKNQILKYYAYPHFNNYIISKADIIYKVYITDLTPVRDLLIDTYNPRGEKPWDPACLFRSYWLMCQYCDGSITEWVEQLKDPFWAIISGFKPGNIPGIGTFYDFEKRLLDFDMGQRSKRLKKKHNFNRKPRKKLKKNEKQKPKHSGIVRRLVERILRDEDKSQPIRPDDILHRIFKKCFVIPSAQRGLLGNADNLAISGDGMVLNTGASQYGIKECDCHRRGIYTCSCPRRFSDPDANWGWDSYRERYVFVYANYTFTAADSPNDLPIFSTLAQASRHDSVTHNVALYRMRTLYPEFNFSQDILDSAHDNYPTYELLNHWGIESFIALNKTNKGNRKYTECEIIVDENGVPHCKSGHKMTYWGPDPQRYRHKWRCPHVCLKSVNCPFFDRPEGDYGRTYYTKFKDDIRIFTQTVRGSKNWKDTMKKRTSSERRNDRVKIDYGLENDKVRSKSRWLTRIIMRDAAIHADAWVKNTDISLDDWINSWFNIDQVA